MPLNDEFLHPGEGSIWIGANKNGASGAKLSGLNATFLLNIFSSGDGIRPLSST
jgi:hypothetical protein